MVVSSLARDRKGSVQSTHWKQGGGLLDAQDSQSSPPSSPRNLSNNKVSEIEDGTFEGAASVSELHLTANQLESIRSGMFRGLDGLRTL